MSAVGSITATALRVVPWMRSRPTPCGVQTLPQRRPWRRVRAVRKAGDTIGGVIEAAAYGVPAGLGDPVFDKLEADWRRR